jgi:hypothetical protein
MYVNGQHNRTTAAVAVWGVLAFAGTANAGAVRHKASRGEDSPGKGEKVLWQEPLDIQSRDLLYGEGGKQHQPAAGPFQFGKEDMSATNPKFTVRDAEGTKWKIKLGDEARPETVATRFVWAAGYSCDEDYLLPQVTVLGLPARIHRGAQLIGPGGAMRNARLEREIPGIKKLGQWKWANGPFTGTREWNGLRVMMALINNWDVKDENNAIYEVAGKDGKRLVYVVSDLGATFGPEHLDSGHKRNKGDLRAFRKTSFIRKTRPDRVDFTVPGAPSLLMALNPIEYFHRRRLMWIGQDIPRQDAHWIGSILSRLSARQIRDAFRAGGYSADEVEAYGAIVEKRIAALTEL